jgi:hypothetical protein
MQIVLQHDEILEALKDYANKLINVAPGNDINIELKAGRGENGYSATLEITPQKLTDSHEPKGPNLLSRSFGSTEAEVGLRTEVMPRTVAPATSILRTETVELPVVGEELVDTAPAEPSIPEDDDDAVVDAYLESKKSETTKSLFTRE